MIYCANPQDCLKANQRSTKTIFSICNDFSGVVQIPTFSSPNVSLPKKEV